MHILVTGSSGTIGTRLCEKLLEEGHEVTGVDREPNKWNEDIQERTIVADLLDTDVFTKLPSDIDAIVHLAANARVYELVENPNRALENFITLFNALEFARTHNVKRFIFASSREGYGNIDTEVLKEDLVRVENCESPYTASKVGGEALVHSYASCYKLEPTIIRFSNVYGMYDDSVRVVPQFFRNAKANEDLVVFGEEKQLDFTYIDDAVDGVMLALNSSNAVGQTFNLAYGTGVTIVHLANRIRELTESSSEIIMDSPRTGEVIKYIADISHAKNILGYDPKVPFDEGIQKTVEWYSSKYA